MSDLAPLDPLDPAEQRVLGSLLEKETTVPASYPLSLNGLRTACNQATSREPVTAYTDDELQAVTLRLQERRLVRLVREHGGRTVKYAQRLAETLGVEGAERALLTVLLLRGPQAPGELKTRTERLHPFAHRGEVEACLAGLAATTPPLVRELPRQPGQQDARWIHLLGPVDVPAAPAPDSTTLPDAVAALARTLKPGAWLRLGVDIGDQSPDVLRAAVVAAGLAVAEWAVTDAPDGGHSVSVVARRPPEEA